MKLKSNRAVNVGRCQLRLKKQRSMGPIMRRLFKWMGVAILLMMLVAWPISGRYNIQLGPAFIGRGSLIIATTPPYDLTPRFYRMRDWSEFDWIPEFGRGRPCSYLVLPLWIEFLVILIPTVSLWIYDHRRSMPGFCRKCGYNLTGNISNRCPECGTFQGEGEKPERGT